LSQITPTSTVFFSKTNEPFNSNENEAFKQDIIIKELITPGLKSGKTVFEKSIVRVDLE
jgi:hypothetical protein